MPDELNLTLPPRKAPKAPASRIVPAMLAVVIALLLVDIALSIGAGRARQGAGGLPESELKKLASKLEQQDLKGPALSAWREYLAGGDLGSHERARIWYRVGLLEQESGRFEPALDAFYRSEASASLKELSPEISRRIQECLEGAGKFADLQHELRERTSPEAEAPAPGGSIVAEIGPRKVTLQELDRRIEKRIDLQLEAFASALPAEERAAQREALLQRFATPEAREAELRNFLMEEVLTRKAREDKLQDEPAVRDLLGMAQRQILAQREMGRELSAKIHITDVDLKTYYEAHKGEFVEKKEGQADRQRTFEEARPEVYGSLRRQKEREVQDELLKSLEKRYDVVIHREALKKR